MIDDNFIHLKTMANTLTGMFMLQTSENISGIKKWIITVSALSFVGLASGAISGFMINRDQEKDIAANAKMIEVYNIEHSKRIKELKEELRDQRQTIMIMLRDIRKAVE
jgi:hypothetical protein